MGNSRPFGASTVLLVGFDAIIGLDLADHLENHGYRVIGPFNCAEALHWIENDTPDLALLDVDLRSGACVLLARILRGRDIPAVIYTGHMQEHALPEFRDLRWIPMPATAGEVTSALVYSPNL